MRKTIKINGKLACDIIDLINLWIPDSHEKMEYPGGGKTVEVKVFDEEYLPGKDSKPFTIELNRDWFTKDTDS